MKSNKTLNLFESAALAALVIHPCATTVHAGVAVGIVRWLCPRRTPVSSSDWSKLHRRLFVPDRLALSLAG